MNMPAWNKVYWLARREFWEHRGGFLRAPIVAAAIFLVLNLMGIITAEVLGAQHSIQVGTNVGVRQIIERMTEGDVRGVRFALDLVMYSATGLVIVVTGFVVFFYCLGALYDDRRDRSILFWKSLPVSDVETVLSKTLCATVLAPAIGVLVGLAAAIVQLIMLAVTLALHGISVWRLLGYAQPLPVLANLLGYIPVHLLWALPAVGWLLLCSAGARSKPFLWALALPVASGLVISWFGIMGLFNESSAWFWKNVVQRALLSVFPGSGNLFGFDSHTLAAHASRDMGLGVVDLSATYQLLASANLWIGVVIGIALLAGATWFRRWRDDS